ncbi:MAG: dockerin type I repeat-containing protein [Ruminococcus sp.]|nr:dockerin type I repeat-containing protein [Ruminococcus sp.]
MLRKLLSLLLSILMIVSIFGVTPVFAEDNETEILGPGLGDNTLPEVAEGCNRYFFYLPKSWENEYTQTAGIYWFEGTGNHGSAWPGVEANKADAEGVYYYDVPKDVDGIIWNNFFDGGNDRTTEEYYAVRRSDGAYMYSYEPGEDDRFPDGIDNYNNMIFVIESGRCGCLHWDYRTFGGDWYYYYGNGEYGTTPERGEVVYTERSFGEYCPHQQPEPPSTSLPEVAEGYNRYFFLMPDFWCSDDTGGISAVYDTGASPCLPADTKGVFYSDIPENVDEFKWKTFENTASSTSPPPVVPDFKLQDCDGKIFVADMQWNVTDITTGDTINYGFWYYYYGNGEYGGLPEVAEGYNRYFFYMPDEWYNEYATEGPGIYWSTDTSSSDEYPGTPLLPADAEGVFYYDVPESVDEFSFTNLLDGGDDFTNPIFSCDHRAPTYPIDADESFTLDNCDGKIFVLHFAYIDFDDYTAKMTFHGMWFYYYGNGEYGTTPVRSEGLIYSSKYLSYALYYVGDADQDRVVNVKDATAIQKHLADIQKCNITAGDVDKNGLNIKDATAIQKYVAGMDVDAPINTIQFYKH